MQSNASAFLSNHTTGVSATYLCDRRFWRSRSPEAGAEWHIAYSTCALENPKGTGAEFDSDVNATSGKVLFSSTLYQLSCGGGSTGGGGGGGGGGNPLSSSYGMTKSTSPTLIGTTWTTNVTPYSLNKTLTYGDLAFSVNNTTMVTPGAGRNITVWNTSTLSGIPTLVASYTFATWTNATQLVGFYDTMVIGTGTYDPGGNTFLATGATGTGLTGDVSLKLAAGNGAAAGQKNLANDLYMGWDGPPTDNYSMPDYLTNFTAYANISLTYGELNFSVTTQSGSPVAPSAAWNVTIWNATTGEVAAYDSFTDAKWLLNGTGPIGTYDTIEVSTGTANPVGDILVATPTATSRANGPYGGQFHVLSVRTNRRTWQFPTECPPQGGYAPATCDPSLGRLVRKSPPPRRRPGNLGTRLKHPYGARVPCGPLGEHGSAALGAAARGDGAPCAAGPTREELTGGVPSSERRLRRAFAISGKRIARADISRSRP